MVAEEGRGAVDAAQGFVHLVGKHCVLHLECVQKRQHHASLLHVLRLVGAAGFATPSDQEEHGDPVDLGIHQ